MQDSLFPEHAAWSRERHAEGVLILAGPLTDAPGAVAIIRAADADEVRGITDQDPVVKAGFFEIDNIRPFKVLVGEPS
ncbi:YciI family protein [Deinococcus sp.]|uniref:YciI family protein n=1 Tax=Deinococcus sp. TaxID=47478 RepID=UPI00345D1EFB